MVSSSPSGPRPPSGPRVAGLHILETLPIVSETFQYSLDESYMTTTVTPSTAATLGHRRSTTAVIVLFTVNGLLLGGWGGVIPSVRERLGLDPIHIAGMLLAGGVFAIVSMQIGGRLTDARGARGIALAGPRPRGGVRPS